MKIFLIAQFFNILACILMVVIGYLKHKKTILWAQNAQFILFSIAYGLQGGIAAVVSNIVSLVRNLICLKWQITLPLQILFIGFQGVFTFITTSNRWIDWLPFVAATCITLSLSSKKDIIIKLACIGSILCFGTYDFFLHNWVVFAFDCFSLVTSLIGVYRIISDKKNPAVPL